MVSLLALIANRVFLKSLPGSVKTSFITKGHGQGVLKRKNYWPEVSVGSPKSLRGAEVEW